SRFIGPGTGNRESWIGGRAGARRTGNGAGPDARPGAWRPPDPGHAPPASLLLVVLDLGELRVDHVVAPRRGAGAGVRARLLGGRGGREPRLRRRLPGLGPGFALGLVAALHRRLDVGDRRLAPADHVARHLVAVVLDRGARRVHQRIGLVARAHQFLELPVLLAVRLGVGDHPLDLLVRQARSGLDLDLLLLAGLLVLGRHVDDAVGV